MSAPFTLYGIPNCDTVRKARAWLTEAGVEHRFHDWRKDGVDAAVLDRAIDAHGWEAVLNRQGTTFRKLPEQERAGLDRAGALAIMLAHPVAIKRPIVEGGDTLLIGFSPDRYAGTFGG